MAAPTCRDGGEVMIPWAKASVGKDETMARGVIRLKGTRIVIIISWDWRGETDM